MGLVYGVVMMSPLRSYLVQFCRASSSEAAVLTDWRVRESKTNHVVSLPSSSRPGIDMTEVAAFGDFHA